jgi:hypothetical protein
MMISVPTEFNKVCKEMLKEDLIVEIIEEIQEKLKEYQDNTKDLRRHRNN